MNLSNKAKYGVRIMMYIATATEPTITVQSIFKIEDVSKRYLEQIFSDLKKHGLVKSIKGKHGGYYIGKELAKITVYDIVEALEGHVELGGLPTEGIREIEDVFKRQLWFPLEEKIRNFLMGITLEQIVAEYRASQSGMFYI